MMAMMASIHFDFLKYTLFEIQCSKDSRLRKLSDSEQYNREL